jgi:hypothetical protein
MALSRPTLGLRFAFGERENPQPGFTMRYWITGQDGSRRLAKTRIV